jgi:hypothetical protein
MKIKCVKVIWDSDIIALQVKNLFADKNEKLRRYRMHCTYTMKLFDGTSIEVVPRENNVVIDALVVATSALQSCMELVHRVCQMEIIFRQTIPYNLEHWQVFNDDSQILYFLHSLKEFSEKQVS